MTNHAEGTEARVCADIAERQRKGIAKYGTTVASNPLPLPAWLRHAYEESLDLPIYLRRALDEIQDQAVENTLLREKLSAALGAMDYALTHLPKHQTNVRFVIAEAMMAIKNTKEIMDTKETDFIEFPKLSRLSRRCIITEKIDGTNAQVYIYEENGKLEIRAGSRTRWISPEDDNHGFAKWVMANKDELLKLGPGRHFGEWWGSGIQRGYGLPKGEKRFSLFNVQRWCMHNAEPQPIPSLNPTETPKMQERAPACCHLVPILSDAIFDTSSVDNILGILQRIGSSAAPGFMNPEGIVVFHVAGNVGFKKTIKDDGIPKSRVKS